MTTKFGVTDTGFVKKTYLDVIDNLHSHAKRMFGSDVDLTPGSPIKLFIDLFAIELVGIWNELELCYKSGFLETSTGSSLNSIGMLVGAERSAGLFATGEITFFRTTPLPSGSPRIVPLGTKVSTASIRSTSYITTQSVYFQPEITDETYTVIEDTYTFDSVNHIYEITAITGLKDSQTTDYSSQVSFSGRTITFDNPVAAGTIITLAYKPLSVTAPITAEYRGADSNVAANTITVLDTPIDFIHYVENEEGIDSGTDIESDSHYRQKIIGATQSIGKATCGALEYYIGQVSDVKNVMIEDPYRIPYNETKTADGTDSFFLTKIPVFSITNVTGSTHGDYTIDNFNKQTGEVTLNTTTTQGETLTINYIYTEPGKIKIYVEDGTIGDENTPDSIVYAIEHTRAAGIKAIGYGTGDPAACGSATAPFSWFYRPTTVEIDVAMTIYFDPDSSLSEASKELILSGIVDEIASYINELDLEGKIYKNKIIQLAMGYDKDIMDAQLTSWHMDSVEKSLTLTSLQTGTMTISIANNIVLTKAVAE